MDAPEHLVLYRKYRPKSFSEIMGQDHIVMVLKNALRLGRVSHAYLFSGTRGTGKTTIARILAKAYNCEKPTKDGEPCNACALCKEFSSGKALDLIEIDAASNRGIDEIRELRDSVRFSPAHAKRKIYIIDEVHMLTKEAFNALLKTLEEPPQHSMFILATTEPEKVPDTILSRVQHFEFRRISQTKIRERLARLAASEKYKIDEESFNLIAFLADGSLRDAETNLGQLMDAYPDGAPKDAVENLFGLPRMKLVHELIDASLAGDPPRILDALFSVLERGVDAKILLRMLMNEVRVLLTVELSSKELERLTRELSEEHVQFFKDHKDAPRKLVEGLLVKLIEAHQVSYRGPFQELPLELALLDIAAEAKS